MCKGRGSRRHRTPKYAMTIKAVLAAFAIVRSLIVKRLWGTRDLLDISCLIISTVQTSDWIWYKKTKETKKGANNANFEAK